MDYEKLHKYTINKLQQMVNSGKITVEIARGICADFVPESEGEKIRKEIISAIEEDWPGHTDWIVWLEMQVEQKPAVIIPNFRVGDVIRVKGSNAEYRITEISDGYYRGQGWCLDIIEGDKSDDYELVEQKPADKDEPRFKVKYAGSEYNVFEIKELAGITFCGIEDEPNHIDYVIADNCEIISGGYGIKENGSPYPTKPAVFSEQNPDWSEEDENHVKSILSTIECCKAQFPNAQSVIEAYNADIEWLKFLKDRVQPQNTWKPSELPHWKKSNLQNDNTTGFNSDYFCHNGYCINYKELFEKLPKDD